MNLKKAEKIAKSIAITGLATSAICCALGTANLINLVKSSPDTIASSVLNDSSIDKSSYYAEVDRKSKDLYDQLKHDTITSSQFKREYDKLNSNESIETWARNSTDPKIQAIVKNFDEQMAINEEYGSKHTNLALGSVAGIVATTIALATTSAYFEKKLQVEENGEASFTPLPDPNGEKPSAMDIDEQYETNMP